MLAKIAPVSQTEILLNDFASRCFRNVADEDYVVARMAYRAGLMVGTLHGIVRQACIDPDSFMVALGARR